MIRFHSILHHLDIESARELNARMPELSNIKLVHRLESDYLETVIPTVSATQKCLTSFLVAGAACSELERIADVKGSISTAVNVAVSTLVSLPAGMLWGAGASRLLGASSFFGPIGLGTAALAAGTLGVAQYFVTKNANASDEALVELGKLSRETETYTDRLHNEHLAQLRTVRDACLAVGGVPLTIFEDYYHALLRAGRLR